MMEEEIENQEYNLHMQVFGKGDHFKSEHKSNLKDFFVLSCLKMLLYFCSEIILYQKF